MISRFPAWLRRLARDVIGWRPLRPEKQVSPERLATGLAALRVDGVASQVMTALITSPFDPSPAGLAGVMTHP